MIDTATNSATVASAHVRVGKQQARPNALIVGPMKAGTSWLYEYLASRDDVVVPSGTKETFYFDERFESKSLAWYLSHFQHVKYTTGKRIIEVAPTYFHPAKVPSRVRETLGEIKIVVTLRDPAERAFSLFQHMRRYGFTSCSEFQDAVVKHPEIIESSLYHESLVRWEQAFGRENVTVLFMEDLKSSPINFAGKCCRALGWPNQHQKRLCRRKSTLQPIHETITWQSLDVSQAICFARSGCIQSFRPPKRLG